MYDERTGQIVQERPKTAAPPRALAPEERRLKIAQAQAAEARAKKIEEAMRLAKDPTATMGKLSAMYNSLIEDRKEIARDPDKTEAERAAERAEIDAALRAIRRRVGGQLGAEMPPPAAKAPAARPKTAEEFAKKYGIP